MKSIRTSCWCLFISLALMFAATDATAFNAQQVYQKVKSSIYTLYSYKYGSRKPKGRGTAVAIGKHTLATNCHVALAGDYLIVKVNNRPMVAKIYYKNEKKDLCLLKVPRASFTPVAIRPSETVNIGEVVYAIGNPRGTEKTLSKGIISNKHRVKDGVWLQTDAAIYYGSSGGGLFDEEGKLIGITAKMGGNFGFAIPTEWILQVIAPKSYIATDRNNRPKTESADSHQLKFDPSLIDYSRAHANLKLLGTYGRNKIALFRNNKECFIMVPGRTDRGKLLSLTLWNPKHPKNLVVFSNATTTKQALVSLYKSIIDRRTKKHINYRSGNILYLAGNPYRMYGSKTDTERYPFFIARFNKNPVNVLEKVRQFTIQFHDRDPSIGNKKITYGMDGFDQAVSSYHKRCGR